MLEGAHSVHPVTDPLLWARFLTGAGLVLVLPGRLLLGRRPENRDRLSRGVLYLGLGFLLLPLWSQAASLLGFGARPWEYLPVVCLAAAGIGRTRLGGALADALDRAEPPPAWLAPSLALATATGAVSILLGFSDYVVPPTTHDAANHAFMTLRVATVGSVSQAAVFGPPFGQPELPYALGLHASAAMIAQTVGLAPYVSSWFLALLSIALLPIATASLWDDWGARPLAIAIGALLVATNPYAPARFLFWGLFGAASGFLLTPLLSRLLFGFWSRGTVPLALAAGAGTGSLMLIHGSEVPTAGLVTLVTIACRRSAPCLAPAGWLVFGATLAVTGSFFFLELVPAYLGGGIAGGDEFLEAPDVFFERTRMVFGGNLGLQGLTLASLLLGLSDRRIRPIALFAMGLLAVTAALALWRDPISSALTTPFYRQPERARYQLVLFLPILLGCALCLLAERFEFAHRSSRRLLVAVALGATLLIGSTLTAQIDAYRGRLQYAPVSADDYVRARQMVDVIGPDEWVLNQFFDGSSWLVHFAGTPLLVPTGWDLIDPEGTSNRNRLAQILRGRPFDSLPERFAWLYVSDLRTGRPRGFTRAKADDNPSLEPVVRGEHSTLYRIERSGSRVRR